MEDFHTSGAVAITLNITENVNKIVFNVYDIEIDQQSVNIKQVSDGKKIEVSDQKYDNISQTYTIVLNENLKKGEQYDLELKFIGQLKQNMQGFYRSYYVDSKTNTTK